MIGIAVTILCVYLTLLIVVIWQWERIASIRGSAQQAPQKFSVIIPFRNEIQNIPDTFQSLESIDYPADMVEFVWVNDHSDDGGAEWLSSQRPTFHQKVLDLGDSHGKKAALTHGIDHACGEYIITLDADCRVTPGWLKVYNEAFIEGPDMVIGNVVVESDGSWSSRFQEVEQMALSGITGVMCQWKKPIMCNGANLGFRKERFLELNGYEGNEKIPSGDDQFLLQKFRIAGLNINYVAETSHAVKTTAAPTWRALLGQRRRWAGKWKSGGWPNMIIALLVGLSSIAIPMLWIGGFLAGNLWLPLAFTLVKIGLDAALVYRVSIRLDSPIRGVKWPLLGLLYPFYGTFIAIGANVGQYEWKGRRYTTG